MKLSEILKDSNYHLSLFKDSAIKSLERNIEIKKGRAFISCIIRNKPIQLKPEEIVRQLYTNLLIEYYGYPKKRIAFEYPVNFGREKKSADIVIFDKYNSGDYTFLKNGDGKNKLDKNGHLIVKHDLHSHDGELPDGIAEAFIGWAKSEKLSFWR